MNNSSTHKRFVKLAKMKENIFHTADLANIWQIKDKNTLYTTLKRYTQKGLLYRIYKGLYALEPAEKLDPYLLGIKALHGFSYISTETVLAKAGIIQQEINYITLISKQSKRFTIGGHKYYSRQMKDEFLFQDAEIITDGNIRIASPERAAADILYFNPRFHFDAKGVINQKKVKKLQKIIGYNVAFPG